MSNEESKTIIAEDVEITGSIKATNSIQMDGKLNGDLNCAANVLVGGTATIKGNMSVETVTILGQVTGNITAKDKVELKSTARVTGDIRAKRMTVEDGVTLVGKSEVNPSGTMPRSSSLSDSRPASDASSDNDVQSMMDEIRKNVKDEAKSKTGGGLFGRK